LIDGAIQIVTQLATGILNMLPQIVQLGLDLIVSLANGISQNLGTLIPTIIDVILQIVNTLTNPETLASLVDASIAIIMGLADGLITALPMLIDQLPIIIDNIIVAITENLPKIIEMGIELVIKLAAGLIKAITQLVSKIPQIITSLVNGFVSYYSKIFQIGKDLVSKVGEGFKNMLSSAGTWGKDMIDNFIGGIKEKWENLKNTVSDVAQSVKDFLGFSEPKKGPLSNFHTYAPDMMDLFAKGIRDNEDVITDQIEKSFDFGERTMKFGAEYSGGYGVATAGGAFGGTTIGSITINIDGAKYDDEETLAMVIAEKIQNMTDRRSAVYA
jgi:phage-related protein